MTASALFFFASLAGILMLSPSLLLLKERKSASEDLLAFAEKNFAASRGEEIFSEIKNFNNLLKIIEQGENESVILSRLIEKIIEKAGKGIKLRSFMYENGKLTISGTADRREGLVGFVNDLKEDEDFLKVESPVSNLLKERDVEFIVFLWIREEK